MDMKQHSSKCTKRHQEAEIVAKVNLFDPSCPRCRLNLAAPDLFKALVGEINAQSILVEALRGDLETTKTMLRKMCSIHAAAIVQTGVPLNEAFAKENEDEEDMDRKLTDGRIIIAHQEASEMHREDRHHMRLPSR